MPRSAEFHIGPGRYSGGRRPIYVGSVGDPSAPASSTASIPRGLAGALDPDCDDELFDCPGKEMEEEEEMAESTDGMDGESKNLPDASKGAAGKNTGAKEMQEGEEEEMDEMDLEEVINALKEDEEEMEEGEKEEDELNAAYETIKYLKDKINEVNLLNAKLLFSNKLFRANNLNEGQKIKLLKLLIELVL